MISTNLRRAADLIGASMDACAVEATRRTLPEAMRTVLEIADGVDGRVE